MNKLRVYIAGPISKGDLMENINQARRANFALMKAGLAPFCPHLTCFSGFSNQPEVLPEGTAHEDWLGCDLPWVECCDILLRLPGESNDADMEVAHAKANNIPVVWTVEEAIATASSLQANRRPPESVGHPGYLTILREMAALHTRKAADYGRGVDPFANVRASSEFGVPSWVGVMIRANDKLHRIKSFVQNGSLKNESVEDSLMDLAAYALIALVLFREQQSGGS